MSQADNATIIHTFEQVAERAGDITDAIVQRYFQRCRDSRALMDHMDEHMLGRMMEQVLLLLMEDGEEGLESYLEFETAAHRSYGVEHRMYESLMSAVQDVIAETLGEAFTAEMAAALSRRIDFLLAEITAAEPH